MAIATSMSARCTVAASARRRVRSMSNIVDGRVAGRSRRQPHHRPAADLDLGVLERTTAAAIATALGRRRNLVAPTLHDAPVEDHFDAALLPEHHAQRLVQLSPPLRHDEEKSLHGPTPARDAAGPTGARARRPPKPAARSGRRTGGRRSAARSAAPPSGTPPAPRRPASPRGGATPPQKLSPHASRGDGQPGLPSSTRLPSSRNARAAFAHAARTSGSTASTKPRSSV